MKKIIVEHMEEEMFDWNVCEYSQMIQCIGPENVLITNVPRDIDLSKFPPEWHCVFHEQRVFEMFPVEQVCLMDEKASATLQPDDSECFEYFLLGGILGNVDEFDTDRTEELRNKGYRTRALGDVQMTLDTAAMATHKIINEGVCFEALRFVDRPEIAISQNETLIVPFRFLQNAVSESPLIAAGIIELLKEKDDFF